MNRPYSKEEVLKILHSITDLSVKDRELDVCFDNSTELCGISEFNYGSFTHQLLCLIEEYMLNNFEHEEIK